MCGEKYTYRAVKEVEYDHQIVVFNRYLLKTMSGRILFMKIITMYLPQFYENDQNNLWWGKGYTDWVAAKEAKGYFGGHNQPREPLRDNYYNLLDEDIMLWQAELMKKYGVYGQCFYHYWFKDGAMALEKPAENLLKRENIDMPFCFCWANMSWVASWSKRENAFAWNRTDRYSTISGSGLLLEQQYGNEQQWKEHFEYLRPFFQDDRYIKKDGHPVFMIYQPSDIGCINEMLNVWNKLAFDYGMKNLYVIGANVSEKGNMDATYHHMAGGGIPARYYVYNNGIRCIDYDILWEYALRQGKFSPKGTYIGGMVDFDTTPRKGKEGIVTLNCTSEKYNYYLKRLLKLNEELGNEFTFINAWNEWGEGMYLEPDKKNKYAFLDATQNALETYQDIEVDRMVDEDDVSMVMDYKNQAQINKLRWKYTERLLCIAEDEKSVGNDLIKRNINKIAIYGWGYLGRHLYKNIIQSNVEVKYVIDQSVTKSDIDVTIVNFKDDWELVDAIVLTILENQEIVRQQIKQKQDILILELGEILP